jgi:hypothetical protein
MTEYYKVIEDYLTRWPTESKFIKAHENYRVEGTADTSWVLGKDYMEGDVIFTFYNELGKRPPLMDFAEGRKLEGILYIMDENEYGYRHLSNKTYSDLSKEKQKMKVAQWTLNRGWGKSSTSWGLKSLPNPFIIVIPYKRMLKGSSFLNWNEIPWSDLK